MFGRHSCRSWRPRTDTPHPADHLPGKCRRCWQLCHRPSQPGGQRCEVCEYELAQHPDPRVRMALVSEGSASELTLSLMTNDADASVADMAKTAAYRFSHQIQRPLPSREPSFEPSAAPEISTRKRAGRHAEN